MQGVSHAFPLGFKSAQPATENKEIDTKAALWFQRFQ
jgi:hypothetical protein